jgi:hypothetical protein
MPPVASTSALLLGPDQTKRLLPTCPNVFPRSLAGCPFLAEQIETQALPNRALLYEF